MASSTSAHVKNIRESSNDKQSHISRGNLGSEHFNERKGKLGSSVDLIQKTVRYEKYSKYWCILSNVAAIVSVSSAIFGVMKKRRWL